MPRFKKGDIDEIAQLARLKPTDDERERYAGQLSTIFDFVEALNEVNTDSIVETCQVTGLQDVVREDMVIERPDEVKRKLIAAFPERVGNLLKVPGVFGSVNQE